MATVDTTRIAAALPGYELGAELGRGGFGAVLAARHRLIDRAVAVKVLLESTVVGDPGGTDLRARFLAEARVLAGLDHPHIVRVYDYVESDGLCLLVMEQLTGGSLRRRQRDEPSDPRVACAFGLAAATALAAAHQRGVLHRDIKPDNIMFTGDGLLKVTDFGIAKILESTAATTTGLVGTPRYMAPEQITGSRLGPGTDLYALAVVLYELLSGRPPFPRDLSVPALLHHHLSVPPLPLAEVPPPLADVVLSALAKEPGWRPPTARDFALALASAATSVFGPGWLAASGVPVQLPDDVLAAAGRVPGSTPTPAELAAGLAPGGLAAAGTGPRPGGAAGGTAPAGTGPGGFTPGGFGPGGFGPGQPGAPGGPSWPPAPTAAPPQLTPTRVDRGRGGGRRRGSASGAPGSGPARPGGAGFLRGGRAVAVAAVSVVAVLAVAAGIGFWLAGRDGPEAEPAYSGPALSVKDMYRASALALGPDGSLYVVDGGGASGAGQVFRLTPDGTVSKIAGTGPSATDEDAPPPVLDDGVPALEANLMEPLGIAVGANGDVYVMDFDDERIRRIDQKGTITTVAGKGADGDGFLANSGRALEAQLNSPEAIEVDADGNIYVGAGYRIRKITPDGMISTVAGSVDEYGTAGDGGPAANATLSNPTGLAVADDGTIYVSDGDAHTVRKIDPDGRISLVAGTPGEYGYEGDGGPATEALLDDPGDLAIGPEGELYIIDNGNNVIRMVKDGIITTFAGKDDAPTGSEDGAVATETRLYDPTGVVVDSSGAVYISQGYDARVRRIDSDGIVHTVLQKAEE